jgi:cysteinyl-tRNA synthetase
LLLDFDEVLGLNLKDVQEQKLVVLPPEIQEYKKQRDVLRKQNKFEKADVIRQKIELGPYIVKDTSEGTTILPK